MRARAGRIAARLGRSEQGLTVVEVIVAGMIMVVGGLGVLGMVDVSSRNTFRAEQSQVVNNVLQREMEAVKALPYEAIALTTLPAEEGGDNNPNSRVVGSGFDTNRGAAESAVKPLVSGGSVAPGPESFQVEDIRGSVYRYVVWDECPEEWLCPEGEQLIKRVAIYREDPAFTRSKLEARFRDLVRRSGLPMPAANFWIGEYELDAYWSEERFAVELDVYETHGTRAAFESDRLRQENLKLQGIESIRITGLRLDREPTRVIERIAALLEQRRSQVNLGS